MHSIALCLAAVFLVLLSNWASAAESKYAGKVNEVTSSTAWGFLKATNPEQGTSADLHLANSQQFQGVNR